MQQREALCERGFITYDSARFETAPTSLFDPHYLSVQGLLSSFGSGRGTVWMFCYQDENYALRHYRRGGQAARLWGDRYLWCGRKRSRPAREAALLDRLLEQGLPVAAPVAWRVVRRGFTYQADLMTRRIADAAPLSQVLRRRALAASDWEQAGRLLRRMHDLQVWHADLNLSNILFRPSGEFFLIDFDRCRVRMGGWWKRRNLERLHRSCRKGKRLEPALRFAEADFEALLRGYAGSAS